MNSAVFHRPLSLAIAVLLTTSLAPALLAAEEQDRAIAARAAMVRKIDERINERLAAAKIEPAPLADDAEFLRRVYLDLTGVVPRVSEVREFLADKRTDKRARLIDKLLEQIMRSLVALHLEH